jgi:hypothetical protein
VEGCHVFVLTKPFVPPHLSEDGNISASAQSE